MKKYLRPVYEQFKQCYSDGTCQFVSWKNREVIIDVIKYDVNDLRRPLLWNAKVMHLYVQGVRMADFPVKPVRKQKQHDCTIFFKSVVSATANSKYIFVFEAVYDEVQYFQAGASVRCTTSPYVEYRKEEPESCFPQSYNKNVPFTYTHYKISKNSIHHT